MQFQEKYKGKVKVIGINGDTDNALELIKKTEVRYKLNFESVEDANEKLADSFMIRTYPVSIVFHKGKVIYVNKKLHNFMDAEFLSMIDKSLN